MPSMQDLLAFYDSKSGLNINLLISWVILGVFFSGLFVKYVDVFFAFALRQLNKIPFFRNSQLDEVFFKQVTEYLKTKVLASMQTAQEIKEEYSQKIQLALSKGDDESVIALSKEKREKLEKLTKDIEESFFSESEVILWKTLMEKYGDRVRAGKWVFDKVKALVEIYKQNKNGSASGAVVQLIGEELRTLGKPSEDPVKSGE